MYLSTSTVLDPSPGAYQENHAQMFRHIGYNVDPYGQSFFPNSISAWNGFAKTLQRLIL